MEKLTFRNKDEFFTKNKLKRGDLFTYQFKWFLHETVVELALEHGLLIKYMDVNTPEYQAFGDTCCKVVMVLSPKLKKKLAHKWCNLN